MGDWRRRAGALAGPVRAAIEAPFYRLYERRLARQLAGWRKPRHLGMIMDGNRRFARQHGGTASFGHRRGAEKLWRVLSWCYDAGIPMVTVWSFSLDNFEREVGEVSALLTLFEEKTREMVENEEVHAKGVRVRYIGRLDLLPDSLREAIAAVEEATAGYQRYQLNIAMAYGGREEITEATPRHLEEERAAGRTLEEVIAGFDASGFERHLYTWGLPEPDLILRTSGEVRLSGFLLWQSAYSELFFCESNWPAFRRIDFLRALRSFHQRHRRYGR